MSEANLQELRNVPIQSPSQEDWAIQEARQRREMGGTVDQVFSSRNMGEAVRRLHQKRQEEQAAGEDFAACKQDYERFCKGVQPGGGRIMQCMVDNRTRVSAPCAAVLDAKEKEEQLRIRKAK